MNPITIQRMYLDSESTGKYARKLEKKERVQRKEYKKKAERIRRKQLKNRYDTMRRAEMPSVNDEKVENIHYSNFLGDKYCDNGSHYNNNTTVNLKFCDSMRCDEDLQPVVAYKMDIDEKFLYFFERRAGSTLWEYTGFAYKNDEDEEQEQKQEQDQ